MVEITLTWQLKETYFALWRVLDDGDKYVFSNRTPYLSVSRSTIKNAVCKHIILLLQTTFNWILYYASTFLKKSSHNKLIILKEPPYLTFILKALPTPAHKVFFTVVRQCCDTGGLVRILTVYSLTVISQTPGAFPNHSVPTKRGAIWDHKMSL